MVRSEKVGRVHTRRVESAVPRTAEQWIAQRPTLWERRFDRLGEFLAQHTEERETSHQGSKS